MIPVALTIAGSDSGGGAGIQADLKSFSALGTFGTSAITAITAQNTQSVRAVEILSPGIVAAQIEAVLDDFTVGAIKIGMAGSADTIVAIASVLHRAGTRAVLDPVMVATSGDRLLAQEAVNALTTRLLPLALLATPNLHEAAILSGMAVARNEVDMAEQGRRILALGAGAVLVKGGHLTGNESVDLLLSPDAPVRRFATPRIETRNDHGTGCTLSAAIAAHLAHGLPLEDAVAEGKRYLSGALAAGAPLRLGRGHGPVHHFHALWKAESGR
ncbi:bifunctional hydroxymethylpyrimidine kinase/phosphomethylpyrimidine kinase [Aureimonas psammosilenae]|uniref:bifunctional hydroxymethylpyrimidine kinase/phosphomethylpyrimidine kinase n=1 Tax=Aureimonas psammosilenae TaxID=2495496 RepID=UPI00126101E3|nr:bifunctional hydroxymethylpyrimidine kinase/phosphomethylpyrimidine kinase [Aureimonas psammosilenae]